MNAMLKESNNVITFDSGNSTSQFVPSTGDQTQMTLATRFFDSNFWFPSTAKLAQSHQRNRHDGNGSADEKFKIICYQAAPNETLELVSATPHSQSFTRSLQSITDKRLLKNRESSQRDLPPDSGWRYLPTCISQ